MTNTTTQHIEALLVKDGHQFAMVRKADLRALLDIAKADPHQGRFLDRHGEYERKLAENREVIEECFQALERNARTFRKHGDERRRYMGNNKALLTTVEAMQESLHITRQAQLWADYYAMDYQKKLIEALCREANLEARLLRLERFKRKYPSVAVLMDVTP